MHCAPQLHNPAGPMQVIVEVRGGLASKIADNRAEHSTQRSVGGIAVNDKRYCLGLDFGTNSVRALIANAEDGQTVAVAVAEYSRGHKGILEDRGNPHIARQHPADYHESLLVSVRKAIEAAQSTPAFAPEKIIGIGIDTTGSTPMPVDEQGTPLAFNPRFEDNLNAMAWLWKDHSAMAEAEQITGLAGQHRPEYLSRCGGTYSSEWFFSKIWHCLNADPDVFEAAYSWVEFCDYIPALLTGNLQPDEIKRSVCAAGHKAMYSDEWGGLPDTEFLSMLDPKIGALRERLYERAYASDVRAGDLCKEWAQKLGLPAGIPVAVGGFDAHYGAIGAGVGEGTVVKIIGTSACDIAVAGAEQGPPDIPGVCGVVKGSVVPGYYGIEAGHMALKLGSRQWATSSIGGLARFARAALSSMRYSQKRPRSWRPAKADCWRWTGTMETARYWWMPG